MATTFLSIPFRRGYKLLLSDALKNYISAKYDQHPNMFVEDLLVIDRLRHEAVTVQEPHVGADFTWLPALGFNTERPVTQNNLRFELANILFNLAALYSQLAVSMINSSTDNIKAGCRYFCNAAGVVAHLRDDILPDLRTAPPEDMDNMTLNSLEELMLAQAQEGVWHRSVIDEMRDASIARLAMQVSDLYSKAGDYAVKSNAISTEWIHQVTAKKWHFESAAHFRQSLDCLEKRRYGEEIARLRESMYCVNEALKETRWVSKLIASDLNGLKARITEDIRRAEKDNDIIYLHPVPPKSGLKPIERANMVGSKAPPEVTDAISMIGEKAPLGPPLFSKLVPYAVHIAASIYTDRRDRLVSQTLVGEIESMTTKLREILQSLNLPGSLQALEKPLGLPPSLITHAEEIRQQDGLNRLYESMQDTSRLKASDKAIFSEGANLLQVEKSEDDRLRLKYGTERWTRELSEVAGKKYHQQMKDIEGYLKSAQNSDDLVASKLQEVDPILRIMQGTNRDLEAHVPSKQKAIMTPAVQKESARLRNCLNEVSRLETRRKRRIQTIKEKASNDNIHPAILLEVQRLERNFPMRDIEPSQFEDLFEERLHIYDSDRDLLEEESLSQTQIIEQLHDANRAFNNARNAGASGKTIISDRERALQELENGYLKYKEILSNIETGRKFYNDLARLVSKFREECRKFTQARRLEAEHLERVASAGDNSNPPKNYGEPLDPSAARLSSSSGPIPFTRTQPQPPLVPQTSPQKQQHLSLAFKPSPLLKRRLPAEQNIASPHSVSASQQQQGPALSRAVSPPVALNKSIFAAPQTMSEQSMPSPFCRTTGMSGVASGTWSPSMPIKFGTTAPTADGASTTAPAVSATDISAGTTAAAEKENTSSSPQKRVWDPDTGLRFA
ncbi:pH-response regulator protein palA/rim20 [Ascosphaera aggregata]|nr:pH-response regulator protein palA/rim20 [Ascosphaera aggregata]